MLVAAGCGGAAGTPTASSTAPPRCATATEAAADLGAGATATAIAIAARDDRFDPVCVELDAAGVVSLVVRNDGGHPHNLTIDDGRSVAVDAGQVGILDVEVARAGMQFVCTIHPGMEGAIRVRR